MVKRRCRSKELQHCLFCESCFFQTMSHYCTKHIETSWGGGKILDVLPMTFGVFLISFRYLFYKESRA